MFRKELLRSIKESLHMLREHSQLVEIRNSKLAAVKEFESRVEMIHDLVTELVSKLPKTHRSVGKAVEMPKTAGLAKKGDKDEGVAKKSDLELLEEELSKVEEELKRLA